MSPCHCPICSLNPSTNTVCNSCHVGKWLQTFLYFSLRKVIVTASAAYTLSLLYSFSFLCILMCSKIGNIGKCVVTGASLLPQCPQPLPYAPGTRWWQRAGQSLSSVRPRATRSQLSSGRGRVARWDWPSVCHRTKSLLMNELLSLWSVSSPSRVSCSLTSHHSPIAACLSPRWVVWPLLMSSTLMAASTAARLSTLRAVLLPKHCWRSQTVSKGREWWRADVVGVGGGL